METKKPIKAKPAFYAYCYQDLQITAREMGYNLLLHGSLDRDMDLVAVPWVNNPKTHIELLNAFCDSLGTERQTTCLGEPDYLFSVLEGERSSYIINLNRGGKFNGYIDEQIYLDISITPILTKNYQYLKNRNRILEKLNIKYRERLGISNEPLKFDDIEMIGIPTNQFNHKTNNK